MDFQTNVSLAPYTYYKIGGPSRFFCQPKSIKDLEKISDFLREKKLRYFILGAGSNVLLDDNGFDGLIIHTGKLNPSLTLDGQDIYAGCSVMVIQLLRLCMTQGVSGFDFLVGIPGNVGGILAMNAGTKSGEVAGSVLEIEAFDLKTKTTRKILKPEMKFSYRHNHFLKPHEIVLTAKFSGKKADPVTVQNEVQSLLETRKKNQPIEKPSCGSVFKNPDPDRKVFAWKLISDAGIQGHTIGKAQISPQHANFIVNLGGAKAEDVKALIALAKTKVKAQFALELEEEVRVVSFDDGKVLSE